ncbi:MAG TPA: metal ABC transporter ATP-binding protein [Dehalococcoidales bacterium]|nr:metal ABC transporter ATP-binding protein [Dehalococcoidales bacterium]
MKAENLKYVSVKDLSIGYQDETIVSGISFELHQGEAIALIGTNGSGKSTLLKTIVQLLKPLSGHISVFGQPPGANPKRIAYLSQFHKSGFILPLRALDVVRMGRFPKLGLVGRHGKEDDEIVNLSMQRMGIEKLAGIPLHFLSGGQQQRTYLAQVLAHRADLLVLDEPTTGLDAGGRELYLKAIYDELSRGTSVVLATHDIQDEASLCHNVMLLARRVVAYGPPHDVITPEALLETFGIVITGEKRRLSVIETHHGHNGTDHSVS